MLIIAVAKNRIGVDMEHLRQKQFASETYSVLYPNNINKLEKWVLLESYNKLLGIGFTKGINLLFNPLHIQSFKRFKEYQYNNTHMYSHFLNETCCIAICYYSALKEQDIAIHKLY